MTTYPCKRHLFPYVVHHSGNSGHGYGSKYPPETHGVVHDPQRQRYRGTGARDGRSQDERASVRGGYAGFTVRPGRGRTGTTDPRRNQEMKRSRAVQTEGRAQVIIVRGVISGIRQG
jgi:hypothetical protein